MDRLVSRWQKRLWRYACRLTDDPEAAWDGPELAGIIRPRRLDDPARFRPWAYRIVTNKANDWLGRKAAGRRLHADAAGDEHRPDDPQQADAKIDLHDVLHRLSGPSRAVLILHYLEGLGLAEVAQVLHVPKGTDKSRLHAARNELRSLLEASNKGDENE
jgi:RNA polymerase sigma-70 factor (ECF subfamily)